MCQVRCDAYMMQMIRYDTMRREIKAKRSQKKGKGKSEIRDEGRAVSR